MLQWLHNLSEDIRTPVGRFWVTCHTFTLALWTQSFAGGVDASAVDADVTGNGAAESSASSMVPPAEDQSAWLSKSCQTFVRHIRTHSTPSNIVRHLQTMSAFLWAQPLLTWHCDVLWCTVMNVLQALRSVRISSRQIVLRGHRVTMQLYFMRLHSP